MKTILCLIGAAILFLTDGCATQPENSGGAYGVTESESGQHRSSQPVYDKYGYWDENGVYHNYPNSYPDRPFPDMPSRPFW